VRFSNRLGLQRSVSISTTARHVGQVIVNKNMAIGDVNKNMAIGDAPI